MKINYPHTLQHLTVPEGYWTPYKTHATPPCTKPRGFKFRIMLPIAKSNLDRETSYCEPIFLARFLNLSSKIPGTYIKVRHDSYNITYPSISTVDLPLLYTPCCVQRVLKKAGIKSTVVQRSVTVRWLTFLHHITEVRGLYPYLNTDYPDCCFRDFSQSLQAYF